MKDVVTPKWAKRKEPGPQEVAMDFNVGIDLLTDDAWVVSQTRGIADPDATNAIFEQVHDNEFWGQLVAGLAPEVALMVQLRYRLDLPARLILGHQAFRVMGIPKNQLPELLRIGKQALRDRLRPEVH